MSKKVKVRTLIRDYEQYCKQYEDVGLPIPASVNTAFFSQWLALKPKKFRKKLQRQYETALKVE